MDRVRDLLGDDAARSLERLAELTKMLEEAGLIEQREGPARAHAPRAASDRLERPARPVLQAHQGAGRSAPAAPPGHRSRAHLPDQAVRVRRPVPASTSSARSATPSIRPAPGAAARRCSCVPDDFEIERTEHLTRSSHRADARPLDVDADARQLPAGQEGGDGAALADLVAVPARLPGPGRVQRDGARPDRPSSCPRCRGTSCTAPTCTTASRSPASCSPGRRGTKQIIMITDGEPTAHITPSGDVFFNYPPVRETVEATLREVVRCTREGIRINTFMLDATSCLTAFIERMTRDQPWPGVLHDPRDARRLRARRLHRAQAPTGPHPPRRLTLSLAVAHY